MNIGFAIVLAVFVALCQTTPAVAQFKVCPVEEAVKRLQDYAVWRHGENAKKLFPVLEEMQQINAKVKNPNLPVGAQLAKPDLDRFQQLRTEMLAVQAKEIVESGYLRDSRVIARLAKVAHDLSLGHTFDEKDPDFFYYSVLRLMSIQQSADGPKITEPKDGECSVAAGLHFYEQLTLKEINDLPLTLAVARLRAVAQKYGLDIKQEGWIENSIASR